jgi:hypothetical protein
MFVHEREEVTGGWRNLYNEELHDLCCLANIINDLTKEDELGRARDTYGEEGKCVQGFGGETWRKETSLKI